MRWLVALLSLFSAALLIGPRLSSAPIEGDTAIGIKVPDESWTATKRFRGGERACVQIAPAEGTTGAAVAITIHDANGKKVAEDKARPEAPSFAAVFWYPPRDGDYKITISASRSDIVYVAIR
jgi:hypothetical protein